LVRRAAASAQNVLISGGARPKLDAPQQRASTKRVALFAFQRSVNCFSMVGRNWHGNVRLWIGCSGSHFAEMRRILAGLTQLGQSGRQIKVVIVRPETI